MCALRDDSGRAPVSRNLVRLRFARMKYGGYGCLGRTVHDVPRAASCKLHTNRGCEDKPRGAFATVQKKCILGIPYWSSPLRQEEGAGVSAPAPRGLSATADSAYHNSLSQPTRNVWDLRFRRRDAVAFLLVAFGQP